MSCRKNINQCYIEICQAFITLDDSFLMQLRDFKSSIAYPGHWGFFAGHVETGESPEKAIWRELQEELCWKPRSLKCLGSLVLEGKTRVHAHLCQMDAVLETLFLQEGQEIGVFTVKEINKKSLFSKKWQKFYPITPSSEKIFQHFIVEEFND